MNTAVKLHLVESGFKDPTHPKWIEELILEEIEKSPKNLRYQNNPWVSLIAVKNLIFYNKLKLFFRNGVRVVEVEPLFAHRELDILLGLDEDYSREYTSPRDFVKWLLLGIKERSFYFSLPNT